MAVRHGTTALSDNTYNATGMKLEASTPAYSATLALTPDAREATYNVGTLTGAMTINLTVTKAQLGDKVFFTFLASGGTRIVTLGTGLTASGTISVPDAKRAGFWAVFDGVSYVGMGREIGA